MPLCAFCRKPVVSAPIVTDGGELCHEECQSRGLLNRRKTMDEPAKLARTAPPKARRSGRRRAG